MSMMKFKIHNKSNVFNGFLSIAEADVEYDSFSTGKTITAKRMMMERGDSVAILLHETDTDSILLVNQFRFPAAEKDLADNRENAGWLLELPAGKIETGEDPAECARREVEEELGYEIEEPRFITSFYVSPGGTSERIWLYVCDVQQAHKTKMGGGVKYEKEDIALFKLHASEIESAIQKGIIRDAKSLVALLWFTSH